jgi:hypothetical protein
MTKRVDKRWRAVWLVVGLAIGCCVPYACNRCVDYVGWLIGSNCWKALIQLEQLKSQSLMTPAAGKDRA